MHKGLQIGIVNGLNKGLMSGLIPGLQKGLQDGLNPLKVKIGGFPKTIDGLKLWLDANIGITKDGNNYINQWADLSNNNNATQIITAGQPLHVANSLKDKYSVRFDGGSDFLYLNATINLINFTFFVVYKSTPGGVNNFLGVGNSGTGACIQHYSDGNLYLGSDASTMIANIGYTTSDFVRVGCCYSNTTYKGYYNGLAHNGSYLENQSFSFGRIGARLSHPTQLLKGDILEIILYNRALADTEITSVDNYLKSKYF